MGTSDLYPMNQKHRCQPGYVIGVLSVLTGSSLVRMSHYLWNLC